MLSKSIAAVAAVAMSAVAASSAHAALAYGLTDNNSIVGFDTNTPSQQISSVRLRSTAGAAIEDLIGIDYRPTNGLLYGVGIYGTIYTINPLTGVASTSASISGVTLTGSRFGFDFNPTNGLLRIVNDSKQSIAVNVDTGVATAGPALNPGNPSLMGSAYTNNFNGATTTTLFDIDAVTNSLYSQNTSTSTVTLVGPLNFDITSVGGFDITTVGGVNTGYAILQRTGDGASEFFTINLATGQAASYGTLVGGDLFDGLAVTIPEPTTLATVAGAGLVALRRRRRQA